MPLLATWHTSFACPKEVSRKRHPTMPALRAPLCCSPVAGLQKPGWRLVPPPAPLLSGTEWGTARLRIPFQVGDIRMILISSHKGRQLELLVNPYSTDFNLCESPSPLFVRFHDCHSYSPNIYRVKSYLLRKPPTVYRVIIDEPEPL